MSQDIDTVRHSLAHIMASAISQLWPEAQFGVGPTVEDGFYYDIFLEGYTISDKDFPKIEKKMREIIKLDEKFIRHEKTLTEALDWAKISNQTFKTELLNDLAKFGTTSKQDIDSKKQLKVEKQQITLYQLGDYIDLCRGPHIKSAGQAGAFKLTRVSGAYWRGDEKNPQMQRIYGLVFATQEELDRYLRLLEEAKLRDHRVLGPQMQIYTISDLVGAGLPLMMPKGETLKNLLIRYMRQEEEKRGYQYVETPVLAHEDLYKRSGHASFYSDDMYKLTDDEGQVFYLKPMNCPHHHMIFEKITSSYRDLPLRLAEAGRIYRKELSGTLTGLIRVRGPITQNDSHLYVTPSQLKQEFIGVLELFKSVYETMGISDYWYRLSLPDFSKDKYGGDKQVWEDAGESIREAMREFGADFVEVEGEAAFYGPKIDVQTRNVMGKEDSIATVQVDILVPQRMDLNYINETGQKVKPIIIHRAILGSYERIIGFLLEKTAGWLPFWLASEQIRVLTINDTVSDYVDEIKQILDGIVINQPLKYNELRYTVDNRNESLGKKIREATNLKVPIQLIVGPKDRDTKQVSVRTKDKEEKMPLSDLAAYIQRL